MHANIRGELEIQSDLLICETPSEIAESKTMIEKTADIVHEACAVEMHSQKVQREKVRRPLYRSRFP